jgi:Tol biopolymer transport system component
MNRDGSGERMVAKFKVTGEFLRAPVWTPDGKALLVSRFTPNRRTGLAGIEFAIEQIDLESGATTVIARDAFGAGISPDGRMLAYVAIDLQSDQQSLIVSKAAGSNSVVIASYRHGFDRFNPPRFSPDGSLLLIAASGRFDIPVLPTPGRQSQARPETALALNGPPWDLWTVRPDGSQLMRITQLGEDQPWAAWSGDGKFVSLMGATGRFVMRPDGSELRRIGDGLVHSVVDWR